MKILSCAASALALALFAGPGFAQTAPADGAPLIQLAQAQLPEAILKLINDKRAAQELSDSELGARVADVKAALDAPDLPGDVKGQLEAMADADKAELASRSQASNAPAPEQPAAEQPAAEQPAAEQPAQDQAAAPVEEPAQPAQKKRKKAQPDQASEQPAEQPAQQAQQAQTEQPAAPAESAPAEAAPAAPVALPDAVTALLNDTRPASDLGKDELAQRAKQARQFARDEKLPEDVRAKLAGMAKADRAALLALEQAPAAPAQAAAEPQPQQAEQPAAEQPVAPATSADSSGQPASAPAAPQVDAAQAKALDGNAGTPEAESKAKAFLGDATPVDSMTDDQLRTRLDGIRDLLAENELSAESERALRDKLRTEREVLRTRMAKVKADEEAQRQAELAKKAAEASQQQAAAGQQPAGSQKSPPKFNFNIIITPDMPREEILRDRRPSDELAPEELRRRIGAYRDVERDQRYADYDQEQRDYWRAMQRRDRELLRRRMMDERAARRAMLNDERDLVVQDEYTGQDEYPADIFAAEVDDSEIERALVAPPRKKVTRRVAVEEIASRPELRQAMTRIEVDTIRFGFNEAFVREEEVDNLDQIASVIERVLSKRPREVFLIEGHTDAVGSDAYNIKLSKARAEAVKKALTAYYVIPPQNLQTVGLGERYLKIPTAEAEAENRRVSISRATPLVGELQD